MAAEPEGEIYSATYSNVPVYELKIGADHVMRRRSDNWINATHILKVAGFDKPARTRILEREVQKGTHEKIQGGYGKYQGTWVPLPDAKALAQKNMILDKVRKIFDFEPGERSPPPAPKHQTAATTRNKTTKPPAQPRRQQIDRYRADDMYEDLVMPYENDETPTEHTPPSSPLLDEEPILQFSAPSTGASRKRKRGMENGVMNRMEQEQIEYGDELLDFFLTSGDDAHGRIVEPPAPPPHFPIDKTIDNQGNNALHWACSMGDLRVVREFLARGANPAAPTDGAGETPLIRAVLFTNNFDKETFPKLVNILSNTITERDWHGSTVFHHIAETTRSRGKWSSAKYYCEVLITKLHEIDPRTVPSILSVQDMNGDTAVLCAARNQCFKVATFLLNYCPEAGDLMNLQGESANEMLRDHSSKHQPFELAPSSPLRPGETLSKRSSRRSQLSKIPAVSRAASTVLTKIGPVMEEASTKLALMYDSEMKEKQTLIAEGQAALEDLEAQRHKIRKETYALMAKADDNNKLHQLNAAYETVVHETESLLEQSEHSTLQAEILAQDQQSPNNAFRINNPNFLTSEEMRAVLPWAQELHRQQNKRRELISTVAVLLSKVGDKNKIEMLRELVVGATGVKKDEVDGMSEELMESLDASAGAAAAAAAVDLMAA